MIFLKQSTAIEVKVGVFVDSTDGVTAETALTITSSEVLLAKGAGDWTAKTEATSLVHESNGWYRCLLDTTDTNTVGTLMLQIAESGALPVWHEYTVIPANVYDSLIGGSDTLDVQVTGMGAGVVTAAAVATDAIDADAMADGAITAATFAAGAITATVIADAAIDAATFAAGAITATVIADGAIDAATFAAGAIDATAIAANAIGASELAADAVAEIADAVWDEAMVEPTAVPAVTGAMRAAIAWLLARDRNKLTQTATTTTLRNDADSGNVATSTVSDDGTTFTRGEWV